MSAPKAVSDVSSLKLDSRRIKRWCKRDVPMMVIWVLDYDQTHETCITTDFGPCQEEEDSGDTIRMRYPTVSMERVLIGGQEKVWVASSTRIWRCCVCPNTNKVRVAHGQSESDCSSADCKTVNTHADCCFAMKGKAFIFALWPKTGFLQNIEEQNLHL